MQAPEVPPPAPSSRAQDVAVIAFCELWGLVFGLPAGEDLYHGAPVTARMITFLSIGSAFAIFGAAWPWLRKKFPLAALVRIATDFGYWLFALAMLSVWLQISSIRTDLETYLMPRVVTDAQAEDLRAYLAAREPHAATVKFDPLDQEAAQYGGQLYSAIRLGGWNVDIDTSDKEPKPRNQGLSIQEIGSNNKPKDLKHDPTNIVRDAFRSAHIFLNGSGGTGAGDYKLFILVGHRPVALFREPSIFNRLGHWLIRLSGGGP